MLLNNLFYYITIFLIFVLFSCSIKEDLINKNNTESYYINKNIEIEAYIDVMCPYSKKSLENIFYLVNKNENKISLKIYYYPQSNVYKTSFNLTQTIICASKQSKNNDILSFIINNKLDLDTQKINNLINKLNIDITKFNDCMNDISTIKEIEENIKLSKEKNIQGTPTFFINNKKYEGLITKDRLIKIINNMRE